MAAWRVCRWRGFVFRPLRSPLIAKCSHNKLVLRHYAVITGNPGIDKSLDAITNGKAENWLRNYENFVGLTEVREAQTKVIQAEARFLQVQGERREKQHQLSAVHTKLKAINAELDKVQRGDERYLVLVQQEFSVIKEESLMERELEILEQQERENFASLSSAVRESHEKERTRADRTKYWSLIGSIIGATIGIIGTSLNNYLRMRELRGIVSESVSGNQEMNSLVSKLSTTMTSQHNQIQTFISDLKSFLPSGGVVGAQTKPITPIKETSLVAATQSHIAEQTKGILALVTRQEQVLEREMSDMKQLLAASGAKSVDGNVVYVGPDMGELLGDTQQNLEWRMKMNALWTVTFVYGAFALTLPILYGIIKGS